MIYWNITIIEDYFNQVTQLSLDIQANIQQQWFEVSQHKNPHDVGRITRCEQGHNYFLVVFQGLPFEFVFEIIHENHTIRLISCEELEFLKHGQVD